MTKITIELEDGTIREINASSYALNAIAPDEDDLITYGGIEVAEEHGRILIASLLAGFTDFANWMYEAMDHGEKTMEEFVGELAEIAYKLLEMGVEDA